MEFYNSRAGTIYCFSLLSRKIRIGPNGTFIGFYLTIYQHIVPNGTVPEGLNMGRIKSNPHWQKSRRDEMFQSLAGFL